MMNAMELFQLAVFFILLVGMLAALMWGLVLRRKKQGERALRKAKKEKMERKKAALANKKATASDAQIIEVEGVKVKFVAAKPPQIVIVSSSSTTRKILQKWLEEAKYEVVVFATPMEAWKFVALEFEKDPTSKPPDLFIGDADQDFFEARAIEHPLLGLIKRTRSEVRFCETPFLLAVDESCLFSMVSMAQKEGVQALLPKPLNRENVLGQISYYMGHQGE